MKNSKRIISFLLVISFLIAPLAQTAYAGSDYGASNWAVHYLEVAGQVAAAVVIKRLTNSVINKVKNSGPNGGPAFIQNWINFTTQSQYQGEGIFRAMLGNTNLCEYFDDDLKNLFGARAESLLGQNTRVGNLDPFALRAKCTLPAGFDIEDYREDFVGNGGWDAWSRLLEPQNNYYGSLFQSLDEVARQRDLAEKSNTNKAIAGKGYFGFGEKDCRVRVGNNCLVPGNIKTPPSTVEQAVANALDNPAKYVSGAKSDAVATAAISVVVTLVINRLFDLAGNSSEPDDSGNYSYSIPSPTRTSDSYKQEFCMAEDNISPEAGLWIKNNYPQVWSSFPVENQECNGSVSLNPLNFGRHDNACGKSYCERVRDEFEKNEYPYARCTETCVGALSGPPGIGLPGATFSPYPLPPTPDPDGEDCSGPALPIPPGEAPDMYYIVQEVEASGISPAEGEVFRDAVIERLHAEDSNWGYNGVRGDPNRRSEDVAAYLAEGPDNPTSVHLIDFITAYGTAGASTAWQDQDEATYTCGVTGLYIYP